MAQVVRTFGREEEEEFVFAYYFVLMSGMMNPLGGYHIGSFSTDSPFNLEKIMGKSSSVYSSTTTTTTTTTNQ